MKIIYTFPILGFGLWLGEKLQETKNIGLATYYFTLLCGFFFTADGLSLEFNESKSPQISKTLLSILAEINIAVVWMVSTCINILLFWEFFTSSSADGFQFEFVWQQASSNQLDTSLYSGRP